MRNLILARSSYALGLLLAGAVFVLCDGGSTPAGAGSRLSPGSLLNLNEIYGKLHAHAARNPGLGPRWNISPIIEAFLEELKRQLIAANRYAVPVPVINVKFPGEAYNPLLQFTDGTLSGLEYLELNGYATLIVAVSKMADDGQSHVLRYTVTACPDWFYYPLPALQPNFDILVDIPLRMMDVVAKIDLGIDIASGLLRVDTNINGGLQAPSEFFIGIKLSAPPNVSLSVRELSVVNKGLLLAEGTGAGGYVFWLGFVAWTLLVVLILFVLSLAVIGYLVYQLRRGGGEVNIKLTTNNEFTKVS